MLYFIYLHVPSITRAPEHPQIILKGPRVKAWWSATKAWFLLKSHLTNMKNKTKAEREERVESGTEVGKEAGYISIYFIYLHIPLYTFIYIIYLHIPSNSCTYVHLPSYTSIYVNISNIKHMRANMKLKDSDNSSSRASPDNFEGSPCKRLVFGDAGGVLKVHIPSNRDAYSFIKERCLFFQKGALQASMPALESLSSLAMMYIKSYEGI